MSKGTERIRRMIANPRTVKSGRIGYADASILFHDASLSGNAKLIKLARELEASPPDNKQYPFADLEPLMNGIEKHEKVLPIEEPAPPVEKTPSKKVTRKKADSNDDIPLPVELEALNG